jgi:hypothetical protein
MRAQAALRDKGRTEYEKKVNIYPHYTTNTLLYNPKDHNNCMAYLYLKITLQKD